MGVPSGPFYIDDLLTWTVDTHTVTTGAVTDADSVPTYRIYEDETGTPILTGSMAKLDDAGTVGFYSEQITLSAANGFEVGKCYSVRVTTAVNSVTAAKSYNFKVIATPAAVVTAATIADAIWDEATAGHLTTANTFGWLIEAINNTTSDLPTAVENATQLLDQAAGVETGLTVRQALRLSASALFGKASGLGTTTAIYRDFGDTKARLTATVDADGNRSSITRDAT